MSTIILFNVPSHQRYPSDIFEWMKNNASPQICYKLMKVCKYFQHKKFPFYSVKNLSNDDLMAAIKSGQHIRSLESICLPLWISGDIFFFRTPVIQPNFYFKIAVCRPRMLWFENQNISIKEFKILTNQGTVKEIRFNDTIINNMEKSESFNNIFKCLPNVNYIIFSKVIPPFISSHTSLTIVEPTFLTIRLSDVPKWFDFDSFTTFAESHAHIYYELYFAEKTSLEFAAKFRLFKNTICIKSKDLPLPPEIKFFSRRLAFLKILIDPSKREMLWEKKRLEK